jgi:predicted metal-dependent phosphoesterase TrpH
VDQLYSHGTIRVIAITDHNTVEGYQKVRILAAPYPDMLVIPGIEIGTPLGDLIVLGTDEAPHILRDVNDVISFAKQRDSLVIVPHPYREYGLGSSAKLYAVDAVETLNGSTSLHMNKLAENLAKEMGLPGVAGSDAHEIDQLWTVRNEIQASLDVDDVLKAIRRGLVKPFPTGKSIRF